MTAGSARRAARLSPLAARLGASNPLLTTGYPGRTIFAGQQKKESSCSVCGTAAAALAGAAIEVGRRK